MVLVRSFSVGIALSLVGGLCSFAGTNYYVSKTGSDTNSGLSVSGAFLTIQRAMDVVGPGGVVTVAGGIYAGFRGGPSGAAGESDYRTR